MGAAVIFHSLSAPTSAGTELFLLAVWNPYPEVYRGCIYNRGTRLVFVNWVIISIEEGGAPKTYSRRLRLTEPYS